MGFVDAAVVNPLQFQSPNKPGPLALSPATVGKRLAPRHQVFLTDFLRRGLACGSPSSSVDDTSASAS